MDQQLLHHESLTKNVVLKPSNRRTVHCLQISILALMARIPRPPGVMIDWLASPGVVSSRESLITHFY